MDGANKYGICEWCLPVNGPAAVEFAANLGFDGIQIGDLGGAGTGFPLLDPALQAMYRAVTERCGIAVHSLHTHALTREGGMRHPPGSTEGKAALAGFDKALEACNAMNIPTLMVASFAASNVTNDYDMENTAKALALYAEHAAARGVALVYEAVTSIDRIMWILDAAGPDVQVCYDTLNPIRFGTGDPARELERLDVTRINHVHVKDMPPDMAGCRFLGKGVGKFRETASILRAKGHSGWFFVENYYCLPPMNTLGSVSQLAAEDLARMRECLG